MKHKKETVCYVVIGACVIFWRDKRETIMTEVLVLSLPRCAVEE